MNKCPRYHLFIICFPGALAAAGQVATPFSRCRAFCRWLLRAGHATIKAPSSMDSLRGSSANIGTIRRRLVCPLRKDDTHRSRSVNYFIKAPPSSSRSHRSCSSWVPVITVVAPALEVLIRQGELIPGVQETVVVRSYRLPLHQSRSTGEARVGAWLEERVVTDCRWKSMSLLYEYVCR